MKSITEMTGLAEVTLIKRVPLTFHVFGPTWANSLQKKIPRPSPGTENRQILEERHCRSTSDSSPRIPKKF